MVRNLFDHKGRSSPTLRVRPVSVEKFAEDGVKRPAKLKGETKPDPLGGSHFFSEPMDSFLEVYCPLSVAYPKWKPRGVGQISKQPSIMIRLGEVAYDKPFDYRQEPFFVALLFRYGSKQLGSFAPISCELAKWDHAGDRCERYEVEAIARRRDGEPKMEQISPRSRNLHATKNRLPTRACNAGAPGTKSGGWRATAQDETAGFTHLPGNSVSDVGERMKGGAVKEDKSPENDAILIATQGTGRN